MLSFFLIIGCLTTREEYQAMLALVADDDADGFYARDDCDDHNAEVRPDVAEVPYDGLDNDCDPYTLDDDLDRDGSVLAQDCDDSEPSTYAGADERCDNADNDCDGLVDEGVLSYFYFDGDADGFGDPERTVEACAASATHVSEAGDCDDGDEAVNPLASEVCNDGVDNNCDGEGCALTGALSVDDAGLRLLGEAHESGFGSSISAGGGVVAIGAPMYNDGEGIVYVYDDLSGEPRFTVEGQYAEQRLGDSLLAIGPLGGMDPMVLIGSATDAQGEVGLSSIYGIPATSQGDEAPLFEGPFILYDLPGFQGDMAVWPDASGGPHLVVGGVNDGTPQVAYLPLVEGWAHFNRDLSGGWSATSSAELGSSLATGDIDGDGADDLLIGAPGTATTYMLNGREMEGDLNDAASLAGPSSSRAGDALAVADISGDGYGELIIAGPRTDSGAGVVWILTNDLVGDLDLESSDASTIRGEESAGLFGYALTASADLDGDGQADLTVGSPLFPGGGQVSVFYGPIDGPRGDADLTIQAESSGDELGAALAGTDSPNNDLLDDLFIGAATYGGSGYDPGAVYFWGGSGL